MDARRCIRACDKVCQKGILRDYNGIPTVDFDIDGCKLCGECAKECPHGVLKEDNKSNWNFVVSIDELRCLGYQKTMCYMVLLKLYFFLPYILLYS